MNVYKVYAILTKNAINGLDLVIIQFILWAYYFKNKVFAPVKGNNQIAFDNSVD